MPDQELMSRIAAFYNAGASRNQANPPTRRDVHEEFGIAISTAQRYLDILEAERRVPPLRRRRPGRDAA